jgi:hypothetical protein
MKVSISLTLVLISQLQASLVHPHLRYQSLDQWKATKAADTEETSMDWLQPLHISTGHFVGMGPGGGIPHHPIAFAQRLRWYFALRTYDSTHVTRS